MTPMSVEFLTMQAVCGAACKEKGGGGERGPGRTGAGAVKREGEVMQEHGRDMTNEEYNQLSDTMKTRFVTEARNNPITCKLLYRTYE